MHRSTFSKLISALCLLALLLTAGCTVRDSSSTPTSEGPTVSTMVQEPSSTPAEETPGEQPGDEDPAPTPDVEQPPVEEPEETPDPNAYTGPDLALREKVDDSFFSDAVFFGNSLVNGLELYGGLGDGDFCCATSASVISVTSTKNTYYYNGAPATLLDAMLQKQYGKIYILLGINEIGFDVGYFTEIYDQMLTKIEAAQPDAKIYIMGISPVTKAKSDKGSPFTMERIKTYNEALYELAVQHECYYVDLVEALADSTGYLPAADSTDGVHLTVAKYSQWSDYLRTHYAGDPNDVKPSEETDIRYYTDNPTQPVESEQPDNSYTTETEEPVDEPTEPTEPVSDTDLEPEEEVSENE